MNIFEEFPSKYLKAEDLKGRTHSVTIERVEREEMNDGKSKPTVYFRGVVKGVVLNKTNATLIASLYGPDTNAWIGQPIMVFPSVVLMDGQNKPCIRFQPPAAQGGSLGAQSAQFNGAPPAMNRTPRVEDEPFRDHAFDDGIPF